MTIKQSYDDKFGNIEEWLRSLNEVEVDKLHNVRAKKILKVLDCLFDEELSNTQAKLLKGYYFDKKNTVTLAKEYNVSPQAVSATIRRGKKRLAKYLKYIYMIF